MLVTGVLSGCDEPPPKPTALRFVQQPIGNTAVTAMPPISVAFVDVTDSVVTSFSDTITVSIANDSTLGGTRKVVAAAGIATFTGLTIRIAGRYRLTATATSLPSVQSAEFVIAPGPGRVLEFETQPANEIFGVTFAKAPVVRLLDSVGNVATLGPASPITLTLGPNPGSSTLGGRQR